MQKGGEDFMKKYEKYQKDRAAYLDPVNQKEEDTPDDEYSGKQDAENLIEAMEKKLTKERDDKRA